MKRLIMILVTLVTLTANCWAGNSVWIQQDNQDSDGSIFIKQDGTGNTVGMSTSAPFKIDGENITIIINQYHDFWENRQKYRFCNYVFIAVTIFRYTKNIRFWNYELYKE